MKDFKVKVKTPLISKVIQEHLFKLGASWADGLKMVQHTGRLYLYMLGDKITFASSQESFDRNPRPRLKPREVLALESIGQIDLIDKLKQGLALNSDIVSFGGHLRYVQLEDAVRVVEMVLGGSHEN